MEQRIVQPDPPEASAPSGAEAPRTLPTPELRNNVRDTPPPALTGPNHRNLLIATALLISVLGLSLFFVPGRSPAPDHRSAPELPDRTFLDLPLPEVPEPPQAGWFEDPEHPPEMPEDWRREWDQGEEPPPEPPVDPRQEAFRRALGSATLRQADSGSPRVAPPTEAEILRGGSAFLPSPEAIAASLDAARNTLASVQGSVGLLEGGGLPGAGGLLGAGGLPGPAPSLPGRSAPGHAGPLVAGRFPAPGPRTLRAGTLIPARLETAIDSDSPGPVTARVLRDVTDSATGQRVLIPAGAQLLGSLDAQLAYGENRVLIAFERLTWPEATYDLPGFDALGGAGTRGLAGDVDHHFWPSLGRATLLALVGAGVQLSQPTRLTTEGLTAQELLAAELGREFGQLTERILSRSLDRRPTVKVPAGARFYIYLNRDLSL